MILRKLHTQSPAPAPGPGDGARASHARVRANVFDSGFAPVRLGRFVLLERLRETITRAVYSAYDPKLDRRVALYLVRPRAGTEGTEGTEGDDSGEGVEGNGAAEGKAESDDAGALGRVLEEAQALTKILHANAVMAYEAGVVEGQVYLVVSYIAGSTLRAWAEDAERNWRHLAEAFCEAGAGLAAAHEIGVIHGEFRAEDVLMDADGQVVVCDFGLGRASELGMSDMRPYTAAFLAPELHEGKDSAKVGPHVDQFSLCAALYEALYGQAPFEGDSAEEVVANIQAGKLREPPKQSDVPPWMFETLKRGMAASPSARYPSMQALLRALRRDPSRTKSYLLFVLMFVLLFAAIAYAIIAQPYSP